MVMDYLSVCAWYLYGQMENMSIISGLLSFNLHSY